MKNPVLGFDTGTRSNLEIPWWLEELYYDTCECCGKRGVNFKNVELVLKDDPSIKKKVYVCKDCCPKLYKEVDL